MNANDEHKTKQIQKNVDIKINEIFEKQIPKKLDIFKDLVLKMFNIDAVERIQVRDVIKIVDDIRREHE